MLDTLARAAVVLAAGYFSFSASAAEGPPAVKAGELVVEPPTLISLGFEWYIDGDANRNAAVAVAYRASGESAWHESLPLTRVQNERTFYANTLWYVAPNMFAGSVFELKENTEYEVRFRLTDPDGDAVTLAAVDGSAAAGTATKNADGIRLTAAGKPLQFRLIAISSTTVDVRTAQLFAESALKVGIKLELSTVDSDTMGSTVYNTDGPDWDLFVWGWDSGTADPSYLLGVPLMLLRLEPARHRFAVIEAGMSLPGELAVSAAVLRPDVAIVDLSLPGLDGVDLARALRRRWLFEAFQLC